MAETLSLAGALFSGTIEASENSATGVVTFQSPDNGPISNATVAVSEADINVGQTWVFASNVVGSTASASAQTDIIDFGQSLLGSTVKTFGGQDNFSTGGVVEESKVRTNADDDRLTIGGKSDISAVSSDISAGKGSDILVFGGSVLTSKVTLGLGADVASFQGNVTNTFISLGAADGTADSDVDELRFQAGSDLNGLVITGAAEGDFLLIGDSRYNYNADSNAWVNAANPSDTRNFS